MGANTAKGGAGASAKFKKAAAGGSPAPTFTGHDTLTPRQFEAVSRYQEGGIHQQLNSYLRGQRSEPGSWVTDEMAHLDAAIRQSRVNVPTTLYRGFSLPKGTDVQALVGTTFRDKAFVSTSTSKAVAEKFTDNLGAEGVLLRIRAPSGTRALHVHAVKTGTHFGEGGNSPEHEVLLPRGTKVKITSIRRRKDGVHVADAEIQ